MDRCPPHTPVLVGVGTAHQREEDPAKAAEPLELMIAALESAARDAGSLKLLEQADTICAARGFWDYADPCRTAAERFGATGVRTEVAEVGVLQTTLFGRAASRIAEGRADIVLVMGGEARFRNLRATISGVEAPLSQQPPGTAPDEVLRPAGDILSAEEIRAGLGRPVNQYAMIENALRAAEGSSLDAHRREVAEMWAGMSRVASQNPDAWSPQPVDADAIRLPGGRNRMLAFPYTKLHNSNWNVDQAAGLVFCSVEKARQLGIPRDRWVFPLAVADSNHMVPLTERRELHRSPGFALATDRALTRAGCQRAEFERAHLELYSCFPSAVRVQMRELAIEPDRPLTLTGGMAFGGGPLNNFVFQAQARMTQVLRGDPGSLGFVSAVSGILTKQGVSLWSTEPRGEPFAFDDVSRETATQVARVEVVDAHRSSARIASYSVLFENDSSSASPLHEPSRSVLLCDLADGRRSVVTSTDPELAQELMTREGCGRSVAIAGANAAELGA